MIKEEYKYSELTSITMLEASGRQRSGKRKFKIN